MQGLQFSRVALGVGLESLGHKILGEDFPKFVGACLLVHHQARKLVGIPNRSLLQGNNLVYRFSIVVIVHAASTSAFRHHKYRTESRNAPWPERPEATYRVRHSEELVPNVCS